jgi:hypothetical protein
MKRTRLTVGRERLRNLTFAEMRKAGGGYVPAGDGDPVPADDGGDGGGGSGPDCWSGCADNTLSYTITHQRSYQLINTIC